MPEVNGAEPTAAAADDAFLAEARARLDVAHERRDQLAAELHAATELAKQYEKIVHLLDPDIPPAVKPGRPKKTEPVRKVPSKVGPERLARIEAIVRDLAGAEDREFRQVDVRDADSTFNSSATALAFRQLRENDVIRFARKEGLNQYFRLTRKALQT